MLTGVDALVEIEVVGACLGVGADASVPGRADQINCLRGGLVDEVHGCVQVFGD
jgi:hypothetical protein